MTFFKSATVALIGSWTCSVILPEGFDKVTLRIVETIQVKCFVWRCGMQGSSRIMTIIGFCNPLLDISIRNLSGIGDLLKKWGRDVILADLNLTTFL